METLNPHSRLNCGRISAIHVPQEAQRGLPTRIFFETRTKTRRRSEYNPRKACRGNVAGRRRRASYAQEAQRSCETRVKAILTEGPFKGPDLSNTFET